MKCEYCDNEIKIGTAQCDRCGAFVEKKSKASKPDAESMETSVAKPKSVVVAYILWALGLIGIGGLHRLYTGRWITGILWLLTFGLFYVGTIIDFVMIFIWHKKGCLGKSSSKCHSAGNNHKKT